MATPSVILVYFRTYLELKLYLKIEHFCLSTVQLTIHVTSNVALENFRLKISILSKNSKYIFEYQLPSRIKWPQATVWVQITSNRMNEWKLMVFLERLPSAAMVMSRELMPWIQSLKYSFLLFSLILPIYRPISTANIHLLPTLT